MIMLFAAELFYSYVNDSLNELLQMKRAREEAECMWNSLRPEVQKYYQKERLTPFSNVPKVGEFNSRLNDLKPVSESVIHALCSEYPHERYLVAGKGFRRHLDEYAVS